MGGKNKKVTTGYHYRVLAHLGIGTRMDALLGISAAGKAAWSGEVTANTTLHINQPNLFGGEKDQGGIEGDVSVMFGKPTQAPNPYLVSQLGDQVTSWRGMATLSFNGARYGANNPYPQKPSFLFRAIKVGWEGDANYDGSACWYPEKAAINVAPQPVASEDLGPTSAGWKYKVVPQGDTADYSADGFDDSAWPTGTMPFGNQDNQPYLVPPFPSHVNTNWPQETKIWIRRRFNVDPVYDFSLTIFIDNFATAWVNGHLVLPRVGNGEVASTAAFQHQINVPAALLRRGVNTIAVLGQDTAGPSGPDWSYAALKINPLGSALYAMNPAHILYYARTHSELGREPLASMHDASFRAGADWFYAQGFGLCTAFDPGAESVDDFIARVGKVAGCSISRSPVDGLWYLDLVNGQYDLASLPVLTDDDILDFAETPSTLGSAVNSMSAEFYDPIADTTTLTPPVDAMALIDAFGRNHQDTQYHEIPAADLAGRVITRDMLAATTPTRAFDLTTTRKPYGWRLNTYFRLQSPKRGISDMVCLLVEKSSGTLKSGAMKLTAAQDVYGLPSASFVAVEPGVDTRPSQIAAAIDQQAVFEAPYTQVVQALSRADLEVLPADVGYLLTVAQDPATSRDYTLTVSVDGGATYSGNETAPWCPTALVVEGDPLSGGLKTSFTISGGTLLTSVTVGSAALWDAEICRVDAIDPVANTLTLGRACADTVPAAHAANSRIWFFDGFTGTDAVEYTNGETVKAKLLTNTGSQQADPSAATPLALAFAGRQVRPYVPGNLKINGTRYPASFTGDLALTWSHRDRIQQANQLIDTTQGNIGPEAGTAYNLRIYDASDALIYVQDGSMGGSFTLTGALEGGVSADPYWSNVAALLHFDGPDGSTTFRDETGKSWARGGSAVISSAHPKFGTGCGSFLNTGVYITSAVLPDFGFGSGEFTVEGWIWTANTTGDRCIFDNRSAGAAGFGIYASTAAGGAAKLGYISNNASIFLPASSASPASQLYHWAVTRQMNAGVGTIRGFIDGTQVLTGTDSRALAASAAAALGASSVGGQGLGGYLDEVRVTKGIARYTSNFTPPSTPFPDASTGLNGRIRFELESARGALTSYQKHNVVVRRSGYGFNYGLTYGGTP